MKGISRGVRWTEQRGISFSVPENPRLAGSLSSYASTSTMRPLSGPYEKTFPMRLPATATAGRS